MKRYTQLTREERYQIYALKQADHTQSEIAGRLDRAIANGGENSVLSSPIESWLPS